VARATGRSCANQRAWLKGERGRTSKTVTYTTGGHPKRFKGGPRIEIKPGDRLSEETDQIKRGTNNSSN